MISGPTFEQATIALPSGKSFTLIAKKFAPKNIYIQSATLNGKRYDKNYISHADILNGGQVIFIMGNKPSKWGVGQTPPMD